MPSSAKETADIGQKLASSNKASSLDKLLSRTRVDWKSEVFYEVLRLPDLSRACLDVLFRHGLTTFTPLGELATPPVLMCSGVNNLALVRYLLEQRKADLEGRDGLGRTALMHAASKGCTGIFRYLMDLGADVNAGDSDGFTSLCLAAYGGHMDVVRLLLDRGASEGRVPSICGAAAGGHIAIIELLLSRDRDINATDTDGMNALDRAIANGHSETVSFLLDRGATFRTFHREEGPLVLTAAISGYTEVLRLLLDRGLPVLSIRNNRGSTCLHGAAQGNQVETLDFLLDRGMEVDVRSFGGQTPLHVAVVNESIESVRLLLERGASLEVYGVMWNDKLLSVTPLMAAASCCTVSTKSFDPARRLAVFELLLDHNKLAEDPERLLMMPSSDGSTVKELVGEGTPAYASFERHLLSHVPVLHGVCKLELLLQDAPSVSFDFWSLSVLLSTLMFRKNGALSPSVWSSTLFRLLDLFPSDLRPFESEPDAVYIQALASRAKDLRHSLHSFLPSQCGRDWTHNRLAWFEAGRLVQHRMKELLKSATGQWRSTRAGE